LQHRHRAGDATLWHVALRAGFADQDARHCDLQGSLDLHHPPALGARGPRPGSGPRPVVAEPHRRYVALRAFTFAREGGLMAKIDLVEVHEIAWEMSDISLDSSKFNLVCNPGARTRLTKFVVVIGADDGSRGEYVAQWGGTKTSLSQVLAAAPALLGRDPLERELFYDYFKRHIRHLDRMGLGLIDTALLDLAGQR